MSSILLKNEVWTQIEQLLKPDEQVVPEGVQETARFFLRENIWCQFSRNPIVLSCREAASRRMRLGYEGIPLSDELRSYAIELGGKDRRFVVLHCRGD